MKNLMLLVAVVFTVMLMSSVYGVPVAHNEVKELSKERESSQHSSQSQSREGRMYSPFIANVETGNMQKGRGREHF